MRRNIPLTIAICALFSVSFAADWPQLQNGPQRQGYSSENLDTPISDTWAKAFSAGFSPDYAHERLHPPVQPIIAGGKLFIGSTMNRFHAFNAVNGNHLWSTTVGGPVLGTAGVAGTHVIFGCMDGVVYSLDVADGSIDYTFDSGQPTGFSTAVLLADGKVFISNRNGVTYALNQSNLSFVWQTDIGAPIMMSSCYDNGKVYFGGMDMRCHALNAGDGSPAWTSEVLWGSTFKDYWPVAYNGYVLIRPRRVQFRADLPAISLYTGALPQSELDKQDTVISINTNNPHEKDFFVLNQSNGQEAMVVAQWSRPVMAGGAPPSCVDGDGKLIVPVKVQDWRGGWGRLDLTTHKVMEVLYDGVLQGSNYRGTGNSDETLLMSAAGRLVFVMHVQEGNAQFTGVWHLDRRVWAGFSPYHVDGSFYSNTQGGGTCPASISNGMIYHTSVNTLNARTATIVP